MKTVCITGANGFIGSHVARQAAAKGYRLRLLLRHEPQPAIRDLGAQVFRGDVRHDADLVPFLEGADALLLATEWNEFREPDFNKMKSLMRRPLIFDGRNIFNPKTVKALGFEYVGVGRR